MSSLNPAPGTSTALLDVKDLIVEFSLGHGRPPLRAVDRVSFEIRQSETLGLVGESGSGKTTIGRAILGLTPIKAGSIRFDGAEISGADFDERRRLSAQLQVIFQDPYSSLNPTRTIGQTLAEGLRNRNKNPKTPEVREQVRWALERVGLPAEAAGRYPARFSGGQRQRIAIARALIVQPRLVICDEPVTALDLSVQAQVLNLLRELQGEFKLSYLFIAHDLSVVRYMSRRLIVLYRGQIMEAGDAAAIYERPAHPYTQALLDAEPVADPDLQRERRMRRVRAAPNISVVARQDSCPFADRCPFVIEICRVARPLLERMTDETEVACHRWKEVGRQNNGKGRLAPTDGVSPPQAAWGTP